MKTWLKLTAIYHDYRKAIAPLMPRSAIELDRHGLHDAIITSCSMTDGELKIVLDTTHALSKWRGGSVTLRFVGVKNRIRTRSLRGQWWLYSELHLTSSASFSLHVLLTNTDLQIDADDVNISVGDSRRDAATN